MSQPCCSYDVNVASTPYGPAALVTSWWSRTTTMSHRGRCAGGRNATDRDEAAASIRPLRGQEARVACGGAGGGGAGGREPGRGGGGRPGLGLGAGSGSGGDEGHGGPAGIVGIPGLHRDRQRGVPTQ